MDVHEQLAQLRRALEGARTMPMSGSVVVHRAELVSQIDAVEAELRHALADAFGNRDGVLDEARREAERIVAEGRQERDRLVSDTEVFRVAKVESDRLRDEAQREADELRRETDEYVDSRLANFEVALAKTMEAVARGRERLHGRSGLYDFGSETDDFAWPEQDRG